MKHSADQEKENWYVDIFFTPSFLNPRGTA